MIRTLPGDDVTGSKFEALDDLLLRLPETLERAGVVAASGELIAPNGDVTEGEVGWSWKSQRIK